MLGKHEALGSISIAHMRARTPEVAMASLPDSLNSTYSP